MLNTIVRYNIYLTLNYSKLKYYRINILQFLIFLLIFPYKKVILNVGKRFALFQILNFQNYQIIIIIIQIFSINDINNLLPVIFI